MNGLSDNAFNLALARACERVAQRVQRQKREQIEQEACEALRTDGFEVERDGEAIIIRVPEAMRVK
jgi:hypothetical protein